MAGVRVFDDNYDDIINLEHPEPKNRPRLSMRQRAAQFSPFAALSGHGAAVKEAGRLTEEKIELDERKKTELDEKLSIIMKHLQERPEVEITYFVPDQRKEGGEYVTVRERVKKIDLYEKRLVLFDGTRIDLDQVYEIEGKILENLDYNF